MSAKKTTRRIFPYDPVMFFPVILLTGIGIVMVFSASSMLALTRFGSEFYYLNRQLVFGVIGIGVLIACRYLPYRMWKVAAYVALLAAFALLALVLVPGIGHEVGGARRWLRFFGISFQPVEFARVAMVLYLAHSLSRKSPDHLHRFSVGFLPHAIVLCVFAVLIYRQPDYGSIVILTMITGIMLFVAGVSLRHLAGAVLLGAPAGLFFLFQAGYRVKRVLSFLDPWKYAGDTGYQIVQSLMAFGTGGIWGAGFGMGYQKRFYLPEPHTDFIFSVIGEELGLVFVLWIVLLFVILLWRGLIIARNTEDPFGSYLALGFSISIGIQASVNMGVALGMLPTKGLTLPFLSYGGTSLVMNMACVGILMNIEASGQPKSA